MTLQLLNTPTALTPFTAPFIAAFGAKNPIMIPSTYTGYGDRVLQFCIPGDIVCDFGGDGVVPYAPSGYGGQTIHYLGYGGWYDQDVPVSKTYDAGQKATMRLVDYAQDLLPGIDIASADDNLIESAYRKAFGSLWSAPAASATQAWIFRTMP